MNSVFFLLLRRMRLPLILVILSHAIAVLGLTLIPGADVNGNPTPPLGFFHAFYFITYTATTIGYTEPVGGFSDAQRLWVTACIYLLVISWSFVIVTLLSCFQDKGLLKALVTNRFLRGLRRINEPFYLVCGYGETGRRVCRALDHLNQRFVVLEIDEARVQELDMEDYRTSPLALHADAGEPRRLLQAGLQHRRCRGVLALTDDESTNLVVAMATRLLSPGIPILARARSATTVANMISCGTHHVINPFQRFASYLSQAIVAPERSRLTELLTALPGTPLPDPHHPPRGHWIVCGYGLFGQAVVRKLEAVGITVTIVDPQADPVPDRRVIRGLGTDAATLEAAGIREAQGIVAGSDNDVANLALAVMAREINSGLFIVTRQNQAANNPLFEAFDSDACMVPSHIVAQECLSILTTPMLAHLVHLLHQCDEAWCARLVATMQKISPDRVPELWRSCLNAQDAAAVHRELMQGRSIRLGDLLRDNRNRDDTLPVVPLLLERDGKPLLLPAEDELLIAGDRLLFAAPEGTRRDVELTLQNGNAMEYVLSGRESGGWLWQWATGARLPRAP
ncbi:MAG: potassium channel protein [Proteobacteria bacterium]|nr:potassium channel protein [Pseudomonadota bacterium]HQR02758.1 NAD-binding protein [Rhodocyclaceae bacterium]